MRVLVTGAGGQLGRELARAKPSGVELLALDRSALDLAQLDSIAPSVERLAPDAILNAAAYTAVDQAESDSEAAFVVNAEAVGLLATAAASRDARFVHVSTDFVFDGEADSPYRPSDTTGPTSVYGRSKLEGERSALDALAATTVVRTSWLYSSHGRNFVTNMLRLMGERDELRVVMDQVGTPTWTAPLAEALWRVIGREDMAGVWHWCDGGTCSWFDFACAIQEEALVRGLLGKSIPIAPVPSTEFPTPATRPAMSALDDSATRATLGIEPLPWRVALGRMLDQMTGTTTRNESTDG